MAALNQQRHDAAGGHDHVAQTRTRAGHRAPGRTDPARRPRPRRRATIKPPNPESVPTTAESPDRRTDPGAPTGTTTTGIAAPAANRRARPPSTGETTGSGEGSSSNQPVRAAARHRRRLHLQPLQPSRQPTSATPASRSTATTATAWTAQVEPADRAEAWPRGVLIDLKSLKKLVGARARQLHARAWSCRSTAPNGSTAPASITDPAWVALTPPLAIKKTQHPLQAAQAASDGFRFAHAVDQQGACVRRRHAAGARPREGGRSGTVPRVLAPPPRLAALGDATLARRARCGPFGARRARALARVVLRCGLSADRAVRARAALQAARLRRGGAHRPRRGRPRSRSVRRSGCRRSSTSELASIRRALGISAASMPASEKGCTGSRGWPSTSVGTSKVRRSLRGGATRPKNRPCSSAPPGPGFLADHVEHHVAPVGEQSARHGARAARDALHHRLAEGQRDQQRREGERARRAGRCRAPASRSPSRAGARGAGRPPPAPRSRPARCPSRPPARARGDPSGRRSARRRWPSSSATCPAGGPSGRGPSRSIVITRLPRRASSSASGRCISWLSSSPWSEDQRTALGGLQAAVAARSAARRALALGRRRWRRWRIPCSGSADPGS